MTAPPPTEQAFRPGQRFGRYEVLCELARGGMGVVAVGRLKGARGVRRLVALKTVHSFLTRDPHYARMFQREAEIASLLHQGNVVPVLELGQEGEEHFLVMEYFPSLPLSALVRAASQREVALPYAVTAGLLAEACAGLHAAHQLRDSRGEFLNVVHRDATPSNLLVGEDGTLKVADFGVARAASARFESLTGDSGLTKGKLSYLAPEQVRGEAVDARTDLFTLGAVLWELLAGRKLFRGENELALVRAIVDGPIPALRELAPETPEVLAAIAARALQRDPADRFASAAEMQEALLSAVRVLPNVSRSAFVRELLGEQFEERRAAIAAAEAALDDASESSTPRVVPPLATANADAEAPTTVRASPRERHAEPSSAPPLPKPPEEAPTPTPAPAVVPAPALVSPPRAPKRSLALPLASGALLALLLFGAWALRGPAPSHSAAAPPAVATPSPPLAPSPPAAPPPSAVPPAPAPVAPVGPVALAPAPPEAPPSGRSRRRGSTSARDTSSRGAQGAPPPPPPAPPAPAPAAPEPPTRRRLEL